MKRGFAYKLIRITIVPLICVALVMFIFNNYLISNTLEKDLEKKLDQSLEFLIQNLSDTIEEEKNKLQIVSRSIALNFLLKYDVKMKNIELYTAVESEKEKGVYNARFEKIEKKIDYLYSANLIKKNLYSENTMADKGIEIFDRHGKKIGVSRARGMKKFTPDFDLRVNKILNFKEELFEIKNYVIDLEENGNTLYYKIMVPVPNRREDMYGVIVLTYPLSKDILRTMHSRLESGVFLLDKYFRNISTSYEKDFKFDFEKHKEKIENGILINEKDEEGEYILKFKALKNMDNQIIAYIGILKDKTQINELEKKLNIVVGILLGSLIIFFSIMSIIEANLLINPIKELIKAMENVEAGKFENIQGIKLPKEFEVFRNKFNVMVKKIGEHIKDIRKRDEALVTMNEELLAILKEKDRVYKSSITDGLTQVYNHKYFQKMLMAELTRSIRYELKISLIMIDIDYFKDFNDKFGHQMGDEALVKVANYMKDLMRGDDIVARYGGEEFVIVLPNTDLEGALIISERIRATIEENTKDELKITISAGVASYPESFMNMDTVNINEREKKNELIRRADVALYTAKKRGRNKTLAYESYFDVTMK